MFALNFSKAIAVAVHPSGDIVVLGRSVGPTDFRPDTPGKMSLMFVARVAPDDGSVRWVRHIQHMSSRCDAVRTFIRPDHLDIDGKGNIFVAMFTAGDGSIGARPAKAATDAGPAIMSFAPDGKLRWAHRVTTDGPRHGALVAGMSADGAGGVDAMIVQVTDPFLLHVDSAGHGTRRTRISTPARGRRDCRYRRGVVTFNNYEEKALERMPDRSFLINGYFTSQEIQIGSMKLQGGTGGPRNANGERVATFWARIEHDGRPRWLRRPPRGAAEWTPVKGDDVLAITHTVSHDRQLRVLNTRTGRAGPILMTMKSGSSSRLRLLRSLGGGQLGIIRHEEVSPASYGGVKVAPGTVLLGRIAGGIAPRPVVLFRRPKAGGAYVTDYTLLSNKAIVAVGSFTGRFEIRGQGVRSKQRMRPCHPGPVGEERPMPEGCVEPVNAEALFLAVWRGVRL